MPRGRSCRSTIAPAEVANVPSVLLLVSHCCGSVVGFCAQIAPASQVWTANASSLFALTRGIYDT
jgi:hypothetical protein